MNGRHTYKCMYMVCVSPRILMTSIKYDSEQYEQISIKYNTHSDISNVLLGI